MKPSFILVSAAPGEPSILWIGKSGLRYRNIVHAKIDNPAYAYTPKEIVKRPEDFPEKAAQVVSNNKNLITVVLLVLAGIVIVKLVK